MQFLSIVTSGLLYGHPGDIVTYPGKYPMIRLLHSPALPQQMLFFSTTPASTKLFVLPQKLLRKSQVPTQPASYLKRREDDLKNDNDLLAA